MPYFPKPFFRTARQCWFVEIDGRQVKLCKIAMKPFGVTARSFRSPVPQSLQPILLLSLSLVATQMWTRSVLANRAA